MRPKDLVVAGTPCSGAALLAEALRDPAPGTPRVDAVMDADTLATVVDRRALRPDRARIVLLSRDPARFAREHRARRGGTLADGALAWHECHEMMTAVALASGLPLLHVRDEEWAGDPVGLVRRVRAFAGLRPGAPVHTAVVQPVDPPLTVRETREIMRALAGSPMPGMLGRVLALPPRQPDAGMADRAATVDWVEEELALVRDALQGGHALAAVEGLKALRDHFGTGFDGLGLELTYEGLSLVLVDLLNAASCHPAAIPVARELLAERPRSADGHRMLALALAATADVPGALASHAASLACAGATGPHPGLPDDLVRVLLRARPDEPALWPLLEAIAAHPALAACVESMLAAEMAAARSPQACSVMGLLRAARGDAGSAAQLLEEALVAFSRDALVCESLARVRARVRDGGERSVPAG
jgi:hypothetical protein